MKITPIKLATNHWGWSLKGIKTWISFGWALPIAVWGIEEGPRVRRRVKIGPLAFGLGYRR